MYTIKPELELQPHVFFGVQTDVANGLVYLDERNILFPSGNKCVRMNTMEKYQDFIPATKRSLGLRALALSADRRYLALSERGDPGGITIYNLKNNTIKLTLRVEDTMVKEFVSVAFSHDFQFLIAQSGDPDWTLYCWELRNKRVAAKVKMGSRSHPINQVSFSPEDSTEICVSGRGVFKLFQLTEENLVLRNIKKLKNMETVNFLGHLWVSKTRVIVGTDSGRLMGVDSGVLDWESGLDSGSPEEMERRECDAVLQPSVMSIAACSNGFVCSAGPDRVYLFEATDDGAFKKSGEIQIPPDPHHHDPCLALKQEVVAMCVSPSGATVLASTDRGQLYSANLISAKQREKGEASKFEFLLHSFHWDTITHMSTCIHKPLIATSSKDLSVCIWNFMTGELEIRKGFPEEPRSVALHPFGLSVMVVLRENLLWMNLLMDTLSLFKEFKLKGCTECAFSNGGHMFAAVCGATVHIYSTASCDPVMKLVDHKAEVRSVRWSEDDGRLVTCDSDGVAYIWDMRSGELVSECSHVTARYTGATISPDAVSVFTIGNDCALREIRDGHRNLLLGVELVLGTIDKHEDVRLLVVKNRSSIPVKIIREVRCDSTVTAVALSREGKLLFCGSSAGTVTAMNCPLRDSKGLFVCRGHGGAITMMEVTYDDKFLLTISEEGYLLVWRIVWFEYTLQRDKKISYLEEVLISKSDLLQKNMDMVNLNFRMEKLKATTQFEARERDKAWETAVSQMREEFTRRMEALEQRNNLLVAEKQNLELEHRKHLKEEREECERVIQDLNLTQALKQGRQYEAFDIAQTSLKKELEDCERLLQCTKDGNKQAMDLLRDSYESKLQKERLQLQASKERLEEQKSEYEAKIEIMEENADAEMLDTSCKYEKKLKDEQERSEKFENEAQLWNQKFMILEAEALKKDQELNRLTAESETHQAQISSLKEDNLALRKEKAKRDAQDAKKENQMFKMSRAVKYAEERKCRLEQEVKDLTLQTNKQELTMWEMKEKVKAMETELMAASEQRYMMGLEMDGLKQKLKACHEDRKQALFRANDSNTILTRFKADLLSCVDSVQDPKNLKASVLELHHRYIQPSDEDVLREDQSKLKDGREKEDVLWGMVNSLQQQLAQEQQLRNAEQLKMMQESATLNVTFMEELNETVRESKAWEEKAHDYEHQLEVLKRKKSPCSTAAKDAE